MYDNLREIWKRRSASARAGLVMGVLLIVALLVWLSVGALQRDYQVLFSGLEPQDAATIVAELDKLKVPYRLGADETTMLVEESQVHATRLKLMGKGVNLRGGVGFEIFNTTDFGVTEFAQKINYQRALQGELARTIMSLDAVKSARVHLVMPDSGLFRRAQPEAEGLDRARAARRPQPAARAGAGHPAAGRRLGAADRRVGGDGARPARRDAEPQRRSGERRGGWSVSAASTRSRPTSRARWSRCSTRPSAPAARSSASM